MSDQPTNGQSAAPAKPMMAAIFNRDLDEARTILEPWFAARMVDRGGVRVRQIATTGGLSHEILLVDLACEIDRESPSTKFAIRIDPVKYRKRLESNLPREFNTLAVLQHTGIPVPRVHWFEDDSSILGSPFYVMDWVEGRTALDQPPYQTAGWLAEMSEADRRLVWTNAMRAMAMVHCTSTDQLGFLRRGAAGGDPLGTHFDFWHDHYRWATKDINDPIGDRAWQWLADNFPVGYPQGLSWGDARLANLMFKGTDCVAVLDWEDVSLSCPLLDLGKWFLKDAMDERGGLPQLPGIGDRNEVIEIWEQLTGHSAHQIRWFEVFNAACGLGLIYQMGRLNAAHAVKHVGPKFNTVRTINDVLERWLDES